MLPDRVSNPGPLTYESGALPIALRNDRGISIDQAVLDPYENVFGYILWFQLLPI